MPTKRIAIPVGCYAHVYNRGTDKRIIFNSKEDAQRFIESLLEFNFIEPTRSLQLHRKGHRYRRNSKRGKRLVRIIAYCLLPNHVHLILEQLVEGGIAEFMKRVMGGYTSYFNDKYRRSGSLFQGKYKFKHIEDNFYLLHLSVYVNLNYAVHQISKEGMSVVLSSFSEYIDIDHQGPFCAPEIVLGQFSSRERYRQYCEETLPYIIERKLQSKFLQKMFID